MNYLIVGTERFLINKEIDLIASNMKEAQKISFDASSKGFKFDAVLRACENVSFFNSQQLIIVYSAQFLRSKGKLADDEVKKLEQYLLNPNPDVSLIITLAQEDGETLDTRKKAYKLLIQHSQYKCFNKMKANEFGHYVMSCIQSMNLKMTADAKKTLLERLPDDLTSVHHELDKLSLWKDTIDKTLIESMIAPLYDDRIFDLLNHLNQKNKDLALRSFHDLINSDQDPIALVYSLSSQYRFMYRVKCLMNQGKDLNGLIKSLSQNPYYIENTMKQARLLSCDQILITLSQLAELDISFKSDSSVNKELSLSLFILKELGVCNR